MTEPASVPVHCPRCAAERGVAIPAACPHREPLALADAACGADDHAAPRLWRVTTSNGRFYQIHDVVAVDEAGARTLAESEDGANGPEALEDERLEAAAIGTEPGGRYIACRVEEREGVAPDDRDQITLVDAGGEG